MFRMTYIFQITAEDAAMLAEEVTMPTIQFVLKVMSNGDLPNLGVVR